MTMSLTMSADDDDRVITYDQLPQAAQTFLKANFATMRVVRRSSLTVRVTGRTSSAITARCPPRLFLPRSAATSARTTLASPLLSWSATAASLR